MTITTATSYDEAATPPLISPRGWVWMTGLAILFITLHYNFIYRMGWIALGEQGKDWSHALAVPLISLYFMYQHRYQILATPRRVFWPGLLILIMGILSYTCWIYPGRNDMFQGYSMILGLFGLTLFLLGPGIMRWLWFPILYLALGVKVSPRIWDMIAGKLQLLAAHLASFFLNFIGVFLNMTTEVHGATIDMWSNGQRLDPLNVAEACAGLRMLMAFIALGVAMAYLTRRPLWHRIIMVLLTIPIAVMVNVGRVTTLGVLYAKVNPELASGDFHTFIGLLMLIPAAFMFMLVGWILDQIFIREELDEPLTVESSTWGGPNRQTWRDAFTAHRGLLVLGTLLAGLGMLYLLLSKLMGVDQFIDGQFATTTVNTTQFAIAAFCAGVVLVMLACAQQPKRMTLGLAIGIGLVLLIGIDYALALGSLLPKDQFLPPWLSQSWLAWALLLGVLCLAATIGLARRMVAAEAAPKPNPRPISLGLSAGVLLAGVLTLNIAVNATEFVLIKKAVPMREPLYRIDRTPGNFRVIGKDQQLTPEVLEMLGTDRYLSRWYSDNPKIERLVDGDESMIWLHIAYYTGTPDTVPHVPERCYTAGGAQPIDLAYPTITLDGPNYFRKNNQWWAFSQAIQHDVRVPANQVPVTLFTYQPRGSNLLANVAYFFVANGRFLPTPDHVRALGFDPRDRYSYYCKVEVGLPLVSDPDQAVHRAQRFLSRIMPDVLACLPDWVDVVEGRWPIETPTHPTDAQVHDQEK